MLSLERKQHKDHTHMSGSMSLCMAENKAYVIAKYKNNTCRPICHKSGSKSLMKVMLTYFSNVL
jgi:hypothetical protein